MTLRCTSLVPPAMVRHRVTRNPWAHRLALAVECGPLGTVEGETLLLHALLVLGAQELAHARGGGRLCAGQGPERGPVAEQAEGLGFGEERSEPAVGVDGPKIGVTVDHPQQRLDPDSEGGAGGDGHTLACQRGPRDLPSFTG